jgi:surface antigen
VIRRIAGMKASTLIVASIAVLAIAGTATAVTLASSNSAPTTTGISTGGYPWAAASCQTQTQTGTLSNGQAGTVCPQDNWVVGGSVNRAKSGYGYRNCTDWVAWRVKQAEGVSLPVGLGNAADWGTRLPLHGIPMSHTPTIGAVAWEPGGDHVAYVEALGPSAGQVVVSEYNEQYLKGHPDWGTGVYDQRTYPSSHFDYFQVESVGTGPSTTTAPTSPTTAPTTTTTTTQASSPSALSYEASVAMTTPDGYEGTASISRGNVQPARLGMRNGTAVLDDSCPIDPQTDAVIPYHVAETNTTSGFSVIMSFSGTFGLFNTVVTNEHTSDGAGTICQQGQDGVGAIGSFGLYGTLNPGESFAQDGFFIVHNYFSPDAPNGDISVLNGPYFTVVNEFGTTSEIPTYSNVQGFVPGGTSLILPLNPQVLTCSTTASQEGESCP